MEPSATVEVVTGVWSLDPACAREVDNAGTDLGGLDVLKVMEVYFLLGVLYVGPPCNDDILCHVAVLSVVSPRGAGYGERGPWFKRVWRSVPQLCLL